MMKLRIGISPCPNDTFIFESIYSKLIDCSPFDFEFIFEDVQTLNELALQNELDIVKISYANYFNVINNYILLRSGGALGKGVGPILIAKEAFDLNLINDKKIAIPGIHTTANFLLQYAFPEIKNVQAFSFSDIENLVIHQQVDAGVIIHENRFTYLQKGLIKLIDLGEYWETQTQLPIPLGGIAIRRNLDVELQYHLNKLIVESIHEANSRLPLLSNFIQTHAQEMSEDVMRQHIQLYVNQYSIDIGEDGLNAVTKMKELLLINKSNLDLFVLNKIV
jgi:1,4-dihydroxy-6-naphthoate synthase